MTKTRRGNLSQGVLLLQDNAPADKSNFGIDKCVFEELIHTPCNPDPTARSYFNLFLKFKRRPGVEMLINRSKKCLVPEGEYIENILKRKFCIFI